MSGEVFFLCSKIAVFGMGALFRAVVSRPPVAALRWTRARFEPCAVIRGGRVRVASPPNLWPFAGSSKGETVNKGQIVGHSPEVGITFRLDGRLVGGGGGLISRE